MLFGLVKMEYFHRYLEIFAGVLGPGALFCGTHIVEGGWMG